jgi:hypothetical protein
MHHLPPCAPYGKGPQPRKTRAGVQAEFLIILIFIDRSFTKLYFEHPPRREHFLLLKIKRVSTLSAACLSAFMFGCIWNAETIRKKSDQVQVLFTYEGRFQTVCLSGDFNDWSPNMHCLARNGDRWTIRLFLSPGRYEYAFVLDGNRWSPDPHAIFYKNDGFGTKNSVLIVE